MQPLQLLRAAFPSPAPAWLCRRFPGPGGVWCWSHPWQTALSAERGCAMALGCSGAGAPPAPWPSVPGAQAAAGDQFPSAAAPAGAGAEGSPAIKSTRSRWSLPSVSPPPPPRSFSPRSLSRLLLFFCFADVSPQHFPAKQDPHVPLHPQPPFPAGSGCKAKASAAEESRGETEARRRLGPAGSPRPSPSASCFVSLAPALSGFWKAL